MVHGNYFSVRDVHYFLPLQFHILDNDYPLHRNNSNGCAAGGWLLDCSTIKRCLTSSQCMTQIQKCRGVKLKDQNIKLKKKKYTLLNSPAEQSKVILYKIDMNMNIGS